MTFLPVYLLGFAQPAVYAYLLFVSFHAVFLHANVRCRLGALEHVLALPRFHHWHHSSEAEALDRNFAVHFPWIDQLFGTKHLRRGPLAVPLRRGGLHAAARAGGRSSCGRCARPDAVSRR